MTSSRSTRLLESLQKIYQRPTRPEEWKFDGNLPWTDPEFGARMLQEHLDDTHGAASRVARERTQQIEWIWNRLELQAGSRVLDITCGPGLYGVEFARLGATVSGVDFAPTSIRYAQELAQREGLADRCDFQQQDIRDLDLPEEQFDAAILLYGQFGVFPKPVAAAILEKIVRVLKPGGSLLLEMLDPAAIDKTDSNWWFTDDGGVWGDRPFLHLGERFWNDDEKLSTERFHTLDLETGTVQEMQLNDQLYEPSALAATLRQTGFSQPEIVHGWGGLELYDAAEWIVYLTQRA